MALTKIFKFSLIHHRFQALNKKCLPQSQVLMFSNSLNSCKNKASDLTSVTSSKVDDNKNPLIPCSSNEIILKEMDKSVCKSEEISYIVEEKDKKVVEKLKEGDILYPYTNELERTKNILINDMKCGVKLGVQKIVGFDFGYRELEIFPRYTDILVIGNGALGLAIAYQIRNKFPFGPQVILLDKNYDIPHKSTNLGEGILWQQSFTEEEEIEMTKYFVEFMSCCKRHTEVPGKPQFDVSYEPLGSLHLADESNVEKLHIKSDLMNQYNVHHKLLSPDNLKKKFPWLNLSDVVFGSLGLANEGLYDPWSFKNAFKCKAANLGVTFVTAEAIDYGTDKEDIRRVVCRLPDGSYNSISFAYLVLASGMETLNLMKIFNDSDFSPFKIKLPLVERRKYEYCFYNPDGPGLNTPVIVDKDGTYFRREGLLGFYVVGVPSISSDDDEENGVYGVFKNRVLPFLKTRIHDYQNYKLFKGWVNNYDTNTANEVGIIGRHPDKCNVIFANGFKHLGLQYVPAVSRAVSELIIYGKYRTIDLSKFHIENLYRRQHLEAERIRKKMIEAQEKVALPD